MLLIVNRALVRSLSLNEQLGRLHADRFGQRPDGDRQADRDLALALDGALELLAALLLEQRGARPAAGAERLLFDGIDLAALDDDVVRLDLLALLGPAGPLDGPAILLAALGRPARALLGLVLLVLRLVLAGAGPAARLAA